MVRRVRVWAPSGRVRGGVALLDALRHALFAALRRGTGGLLLTLLLSAAYAGGSAQGAGAEPPVGLAAIAERLTAAPGPALAAQATADGHWRFLSPRGEVFTAGTPEEIARVGDILFPDLPRGAELAIYVDADTIFLHRAHLATLPKGSTLHLVAGAASYPVVGRAEREPLRLFAQLRPNLALELEERAGFEEALWQLARPLAAAGVRILALEPGAPPVLASSPRVEPGSERALVDAIDPRRLAAALANVRGQTLLITGRIAGGLMFVQPARGEEQSLPVADLVAAAEAADVNLIVLHAATTPRQPGGRNWLWRRVEVEGLDAALANPTLADFFDALGAANRQLVVAAKAAPRRATLTMLPAAGSSPALDVGGMLGGALAQLTGRVTIAGVVANLNSAARERELAWRMVPGIPAALQLGYPALVLLGLLGLAPARSWWRRLWPPEAAADYAGRSGYLAAAAVRGLAFVLLFLPLSAAISLPYLLVRAVGRGRSGSGRERLARRVPAGP